MARISPQIRQEILDKTDFLSVYQEHVRLQKKGASFWGLCPFHSEKTPSFSVSPDTGLFYCFGCHKGGSIIQFMMDIDRLSYTEAMQELAQRCGVQIHFEESEELGETEKERQALLELNERLSKTFHWFLMNHDYGRAALEILHKRGLSNELIEKFRIGYAPANRQWLYSFLKAKGYSDDFLKHSGFFSKKDLAYPLFADRIMFPIGDAKGRIIAFGGRAMTEDGPKYINSPETAVFRKQETLFAFSQAIDSIKSTDTAIVCEGYMDALSFHAAGLINAVAPLGTAFTSQQAILIRRRSSNIILCFDTDEAGLRAAERACSIATAAGLETRVLLLEEGKDASEILEKKGAGELTRMAKNTINAGYFLLTRANQLFDISTMEGKAKAVSFLFPFLDALDSDVKRQEYIKEVGRNIGVSTHAVAMDYAKAKVSGMRRVRNSYSLSNNVPYGSSNSARTSDLLFMAAIILSENPFQFIDENLDIEYFDDPRAKDLFSALQEAQKEGILDIEGILSRCTDEAAARFVREVDTSGELQGGLEKIIKDGLEQKKKASLERKRRSLVAQLQSLSVDADPLQEKLILEEIINIDGELKATGGDINE
ncbi:MAG: DNA primase [Spirochaetes bacterium ADurb.Bin110]|nr:MAG: DNA primase [Spirochaetes bacterium ADurb.Bin110]